LEQTNNDAHGELTAQLEDLLNSLSNKFAGVSSEIFAKSIPFPTPRFVTPEADKRSG
jgi:heat shock factor-binding protein 1